MANTTGRKFGGRTIGTPNKTTAEIREKIKDVFNNNIDKIQEDINKLEPKERLEIMIKFLPYIVPKQSEIAIENKENEFKPIILEIAETGDIE